MDTNNGKIWAYCRVSSNSQSLQHQIDQCLAYGVPERNIIVEKKSGKDFERPAYQALKTQMLRPFDRLVLCSLDRLGRDLEQVRSEYRAIQKMSVDIVVLDMPVLTTADKTDLEKTLISSILLELLAYLSQKTRKDIRAKQAMGIKSAMEKGVKFGRPTGYTLPQGWAVETAAWRRGEQTAVATMNKLGLKKTAFYKYVQAEGA